MHWNEEKCREMQRNVEKCRDILRNEEKYRKMQRNAEKLRNAKIVEKWKKCREMSYLITLKTLHLENVEHVGYYRKLKNLDICSIVVNLIHTSNAWFCSLYWTLNHSESDWWMYIGSIALNLKKVGAAAAGM